MAAIVSGEAAAVDGRNSPSIVNRKVDASTWLIQYPPSGCNAELKHGGSWSGTVKRPDGSSNPVKG